MAQHHTFSYHRCQDNSHQTYRKVYLSVWRTNIIADDQGSNFESSVFQEVCNILDIQKTHTTPGRSQSDGMIKRACRSMQAMLSADVTQNQKDWDRYVPLLMMAYQSSVHDNTKNDAWKRNQATHRSSVGDT